MFNSGKYKVEGIKSMGLEMGKKSKGGKEEKTIFEDFTLLGSSNR